MSEMDRLNDLTFGDLGLQGDEELFLSDDDGGDTFNDDTFGGGLGDAEWEETTYDDAAARDEAMRREFLRAQGLDEDAVEAELGALHGKEDSYSDEDDSQEQGEVEDDGAVEFHQMDSFFQELDDDPVDLFPPSSGLGSSGPSLGDGLASGGIMSGTAMPPAQLPQHVMSPLPQQPQQPLVQPHLPAPMAPPPIEPAPEQLIAATPPPPPGTQFPPWFHRVPGWPAHVIAFLHAQQRLPIPVMAVLQHQHHLFLSLARAQHPPGFGLQPHMRPQNASNMPHGPPHGHQMSPNAPPPHMQPQSQQPQSHQQQGRSHASDHRHSPPDRQGDGDNDRRDRNDRRGRDDRRDRDDRRGRNDRHDHDDRRDRDDRRQRDSDRQSSRDRSRGRDRDRRRDDDDRRDRGDSRRRRDDKRRRGGKSDKSDDDRVFDRHHHMDLWKWPKRKSRMLTHEVDQLLSIHRNQLRFSRYADDFYFQTFARSLRGHLPKGSPPVQKIHRPMSLEDPPPERKLDPKLFRDALGTIPFTSVHAPKPVVKLSPPLPPLDDAEGDARIAAKVLRLLKWAASAHSVTGSSAPSAAGTRPSHHFLLAVETAYDLLLDVEDFARVMDDIEGKVTNFMFYANKHGQRLADLHRVLAAFVPKDIPTSDSELAGTLFGRLLCLSKGRILLARSVAQMTTSRAAEMVMLVLQYVNCVRHELVTGDASTVKLFVALARVTTRLGAQHLLAGLQSVTKSLVVQPDGAAAGDDDDGQCLQVVGSLGGTRLLCALLDTAHTCCARDDFPQQQWQDAVTAFTTALEPLLAQLAAPSSTAASATDASASKDFIPPTSDTHPTTPLHVWTLLTSVAVASSDAFRSSMKAALKPFLIRSPASWPSMQRLVSALGIPSTDIPT